MDAIRPEFLSFLLALVAAEAGWSAWRKLGLYDVKEVLCNLGIMLGNNLIKPLSLAWGYLIFSALEGFQFYTLPATAWGFLLTFLIVDCAYYWYHRLSHEIPILWTMHHTHHSSPWMNLTTAIRLNWIAKFISPIFFAPLVLLGFSAEWTVISLALGLFFQFFLHTEAIGRLGWFEGKLLNTPSAHRVHHGSNSAYIDKNYAGALIIWDRLFGTYAAEQEKVCYGVTTGFVGHNPFVVQLAPLWKYLQGEWKREKQVDTERMAAHQVMT
ncbi:MAG: sterol desaturase family protein [Pseudomonadota bacterium]